MKNNVIYNNAYGILGLLPNVSQKELSRRLKEIEKFISIGELPDYSYDYNVYNKERNSQSIHNAFLNISNVNTQLLHHFFRVYANSEKQIELLNSIEKDFSYENINNIYWDTTKKNFILDKNIAITLTLLILSDNFDNIYDEISLCIDIWYSILYNEKYIKDFKKIFLLDDELGIDEAVLDNIEDRLIEELTKVFSDISKKYDNRQILSMFINKFQLNNNVFNIDIVEEIYSNIQKHIEIMDSMDISADGVFDNQEKALLKKCLSSFQDDFNKLIDLGLYNNEKTVIIRDLVATKIRIQIIDLFNNLEEDETALNLMKFAIYIVGTEGLKKKLEEELSFIKTNISITKLVNPIDNIIENLKKESSYYTLDNIKNSISNIKGKCILIEQEKNISKDNMINMLNMFAIKIRSIAIDLHNKNQKYKESQLLLNFALELAQTQNIKDICIKDLQVVNKTVEEKCGFSGFLKGTGGCLSYIIFWLIIIGIISLFGG